MPLLLGGSNRVFGGSGHDGGMVESIKGWIEMDPGCFFLKRARFWMNDLVVHHQNEQMCHIEVEEENHLPFSIIFRFHVDLRGCNSQPV